MWLNKAVPVYCLVRCCKTYKKYHTKCILQYHTAFPETWKHDETWGPGGVPLEKNTLEKLQESSPHKMDTRVMSVPALFPHHLPTSLNPSVSLNSNLTKPLASHHSMMKFIISNSNEWSNSSVLPCVQIFGTKLRSSHRPCHPRRAPNQTPERTLRMQRAPRSPRGVPVARDPPVAEEVTQPEHVSATKKDEKGRFQPWFV